MEPSAILPTYHFSFPPKPNPPKASPPWPCNRRSSQPSRLHCHKMFVPGFGEASPESKAAKNLHSFFTYVAVKIVVAQLEHDLEATLSLNAGPRNLFLSVIKNSKSYNPEAYQELMEFLSRNSLNDGDQFCANLMRESPRHKGLALRILEVRSAYCKKDFEWDNMKRLALKMVDESNTRLMRDYVLETSHLENDQ